jgi:hypothetical protein
MRGPHPLPVCIRGMHYASPAAAAQALGISPATVRSLLARGRADQAGIGPGKSGGPAKRSNAHAVTIGPLKFATKEEAAKALGYSRSHFIRTLRSGNMAPIYARAMKLADEHYRKRKAAQ